MAPPAAGTDPLILSAEALRFQRQNKHNPLFALKPEMLSRALDQFEHGYLREAVLLWEKIAERDDTIASVKPKREKDVSQLDMQVVVSPDAGADGDRHKAILERFWKNVRCVNSYDRNERGGFRRLVKQMMTAVSYRYAVHHIVWQPRPDGELRATFEFVPLWQFENRTGRLRYLPSLSATGGEILVDGEWMVTTGDGLMIACSIGYLAKRSAFNDWLIFSEKFSVPGVMGRTSAKKGSAEAEAMRAAVESFGHDWVACIYGDDGTHDEPIKLIQAQGSPQGMPMPAVVERVDRKFAALYRGADLSSMSSSSGEGTGASLQEKETDILRRDDAETIAETLEEISRMVIEWHEGNGTEPLARVELVVPVQEDTTKVIEAGIRLAENGARVSKSALMERANIPEAKDEADVLGKTQDGKTQDAGPGEEKIVIENADLPDDWTERLTAALSSDLQPLGTALAGALQAGDEQAFQAALKKISERMPEFLESEALQELLEEEMVRALLGDDEEVENLFNPLQSRDLMGRWDGGSGGGGRNFYRRGDGREGESTGFKTDVFGRIPGGDGENLSARDNLARASKAVEWAFRNQQAVRGVVWRNGLGRVDLPAGRVGVIDKDYQRGEGVAHISAKHPEDVTNLARTLSLGRIGPAYKPDGKLDKEKRAISYKNYLCVVVKKTGDPNSWILTHYYDPKK